ncbi:hypothetical protein [Arthrobacter sp. AL12]|nr:hypothetical protein [Arthrobacter sp. AL12]MDI3212310.1 hypothetical protein [Arthrobacter sp. AL12]
MSGLVDNILNVSPLLALVIVGVLVFAEDAFFLDSWPVTHMTR